MKEVEVQGVGKFKVKYNYLHRGQRPRIITFDKGDYKEVQFNMYNKYETGYQDGYNIKGQPIKLKLT